MSVSEREVVAHQFDTSVIHHVSLGNRKTHHGSPLWRGLLTASVVALVGVSLVVTHPRSGAADDQDSSNPYAEMLPRLMRLPNAVDANQDGELSTDEILRASQNLHKVDTSKDGTIDHREIGTDPKQLPLVRWHMVTNVLDRDGDVRLSAQEIAQAAESLRLLDKNGDWRVDRTEMSMRGDPELPVFNTQGMNFEQWERFRTYTYKIAGPITPGTYKDEFKAYTLVHDAGDFGQVQVAKGTHLLDPQGKKVHTWQASGYHPEASVSYLLPNGNLLRTYSDHHWTKDEHYPVGSCSSIELLDWKGKVLWTFRMSEPKKYSFHHDVEFLPNGNILAIRYTAFTREEAIAIGWEAKGSEKAIRRAEPEGSGLVWMDAILELKPDLKEGGTEIVWQWNSWEHLVQDKDAKKPNFGKVSDPAKINVNYLELDTDVPFNKGQLFHTNAVDYNPQLDMILVSVATYGELWFIDHSTSASEVKGSSGGRYGKGGDLIYRYGNQDAHGVGTRDDATLFWQHDAHWIGDGLPGAGHVLVYNNGSRRTLDDTFMKQPPKNILDGSYTNLLEVKMPFDGNRIAHGKQAEVVWSWQAKNKAEYFSPFMSGLQRLPNGNTIFCRAYDKWVKEVTPAGETVLDYSLQGWGRLHRIYKFAPDYSGLKLDK